MEAPRPDKLDKPMEAVPRGKPASRGGTSLGQIILRRYTVRHLLGVGSMGHVLLAREMTTGDEVAIKCVPPQWATSEPHMRSIQANYELVRGLVHPHIAALRGLERDPDNGQYYVIMELVRGVDLSQWLMERHAKSPVLPMELVLGLAEQIASALDYAHTRPVENGSGTAPNRFGILHRDMKPANVMVDREREYRPGIPFVKIVDFGLATQIQASLLSISLNMHNKLAGTPVYMAPEQWDGRTLTRGVDQWALAVMIHEMAVGHRPFDALSEAAVMNNILKSNPPKPAVLSNAQWDALKVAFNLDRRKRYRSCVELVKTIAEADLTTSHAIVATVVPMPDEFAGLAVKETEMEVEAERSGIAIALAAERPPPPPPESSPKWLYAAALATVLACGSYVAMKGFATGKKLPGLVSAHFDTPDSGIVNPSDLVPNNSPEGAHQSLTRAMEAITDPHVKGSWARTKALLEGPAQNPLNANHPGLETAKSLLKTAEAELAKAPAFEERLDQAVRELKANRNVEALVDFDAARAIWPESGRNDEIYQYKKQAREAIAAQRAAQNQKTLDLAWALFGAPTPDGRKWEDVVAALEPALELEGNSNHVHFADAQKLLNQAKAELAFQKILKKGTALAEVARFEDALMVFNAARSQTTEQAKLSLLQSAVESAKKRYAEFKETVANEAKNTN